jgi:small subunit ribosomal protein S20
VANIKSQIKRNRTSAERRERNKAVKSSLKTAARRVHESQAAGDAERTATLLADACRQLDKAASKGAIHQNQAAQRKSGLARSVRE